MERAIVLCSGPSLDLYHTSDGLVIGVNRAAILHWCDVWCCLDRVSSIDGGSGGVTGWHDDVIDTPPLVTCEATWRDLRGFDWPLAALREDFAAAYPKNLRWEIYSSTTGIAYAAWLGATVIDVYGMDLAGELDADGVNPSIHRRPEKWAKQRAVFEALQSYLDSKGIKVIRHINE